MNARHYDWIAYHGRYTPEKLACVDLGSGRRLTYRALHRRINAVARLLADDLGVRDGDRVCVVARSCSDVFEIQFACAKLGAIFLPVNWRLTVNELEVILRDADPVALLHEREFTSTAEELKARIGLDACVDFGGGAPDTRYERAIREYQDAGFVDHPVDVESTWAMLYTSGTTGRPKGAMLSYRMMLTNVLNFSFPARLGPGTVFLCAMPTFHTGGLNCYSNPVFHAGGTVVIMREFEPAEALELMMDRDLGVTHFFGAPAHYLFVSQQPGFARAAFPAMAIAGLGAAPPTHTLIKAWLDKGVPLQPAYGMTEIGPAILISDLQRVREKVGSAGQPVMHGDFKIAAPDGRELPPGEIGEIWVKGPTLMSGYWRQPEVTASSFHDGWFRTGDAAHRDDEGFVFIVDRLKDMYISGGENVYPAEVENVISAIPEVSAAAVVGIPDATWGEVGRAFIIVRPGCTLAAEAVQTHCRRNLAKYKVPKVVTFVDSFPRTPTGKLLKRALREWDRTSDRS